MRGFKLGLIKDGIRKASAVDREELLREKERDANVEDKIIFATTYNPMIPQLREKIVNLHPILHSSERCKKLFPDPPILAYRRGRNLNDLLVSRRLPPDTVVHTNNNNPPPTSNIDADSNVCEECGRTFKNGRGKMIHFNKAHLQKATATTTSTAPGFTKCGDSRCNTCKVGTFGTTIHVSSTNKTFVIRNPMTCKSSNVIYCVTCQKCKEQYIGETEQEIHKRQRGHLSALLNGLVFLLWKC